ncbi:MAG TPA: hypothetical protein VGQ21_17785, partial [Thermoanaerobaculia bacterium]|nr:hypothetical protein [Thermoanaerobaculia bacterium]
VYERIFDNVGDDWTDRFRLTPIGGDVLESAIEAWGIWSRWFAAHKAGKTPAGTHPALPEEREHFFHLKSLVDNAVSKNESRSFVAYGEFSGGESGILAGDLQSLNVVWRLLDV